MHEIAGLPMERCGMDLSRPWLLSREGNTYLCVLQENFVKLIKVSAMPDKTARRLANCLVKFNRKYGHIMKLHSESLLPMLINNSVSSGAYVRR